MASSFMSFKRGGGVTFAVDNTDKCFPLRTMMFGLKLWYSQTTVNSLTRQMQKVYPENQSIIHFQ